MKKISIFLFLFVSTLANAQSFTVKGTVYDENKKPLEGASVSVIDSKTGVITNSLGKFELKLTSGEFYIEAKYLGYKSQMQGVSIIDKNINNINFYLQSDATVLEEVLVSAVRVNADVPVTFSNLSKKEIAKRNLGQDIPVLLNYLPSVVSSSDAGAATLAIQGVINYPSRLQISSKTRVLQLTTEFNNYFF